MFRFGRRFSPSGSGLWFFFNIKVQLSAVWYILIVDLITGVFIILLSTYGLRYLTGIMLHAILFMFMLWCDLNNLNLCDAACKDRDIPFGFEGLTCPSHFVEIRVRILCTKKK